MLYRLLGIVTWKVAKRVVRRKLSAAPVGARPVMLGGVAAALLAARVRRGRQGGLAAS